MKTKTLTMGGRKLLVRDINGDLDVRSEKGRTTIQVTLTGPDKLVDAVSIRLVGGTAVISGSGQASGLRGFLARLLGGSSSTPSSRTLTAQNTGDAHATGGGTANSGIIVEDDQAIRGSGNRLTITVLVPNGINRRAENIHGDCMLA